MTLSFRSASLVLFLGVSLSACGGGAAVERESAAMAATPNVAISDSEVLRLTFMETNNQADITRVINDARRGGMTDPDIANSLGEAYHRAPRRRVMFSVNFIHFREGSTSEASVLDAAYEEGRTSPAERAAEEARIAQAAAAAAAAEEAAQEEEARRAREASRTEEPEAEDEEEEPRQRGWRRWIPGL